MAFRVMKHNTVHTVNLHPYIRVLTHTGLVRTYFCSKAKKKGQKKQKQKENSYINAKNGKKKYAMEHLYVFFSIAR